MKNIFFLSVLFASFLHAADPNKPHNHSGIVKPYDKEPTINLTKEELEKINSGTPIYKQTENSSSGKAVAVFRVEAPEKVIWKILSDIESYPKWISNLSSAKIYKKEGSKIFAEFTVKVWPTTTTYYVEHDYPSNFTGYGTWRLDYSRLSDLDESVGFWMVKPIENNPNASLVYYSVDVHVRGFLSLIKGFIVDKGLREATQWVKLASESLVAQNKEKENQENPNKLTTATPNPNPKAL